VGGNSICYILVKAFGIFMKADQRKEKQSNICTLYSSCQHRVVVFKESLIWQAVGWGGLGGERGWAGTKLFLEVRELSQGL
jgi:hypothetical protein